MAALAAHRFDKRLLDARETQTTLVIDEKSPLFRLHGEEASFLLGELELAGFTVCCVGSDTVSAEGDGDRPTACEETKPA